MSDMQQTIESQEFHKLDIQKQNMYEAITVQWTPSGWVPQFIFSTSITDMLKIIYRLKREFIERPGPQQIPVNCLHAQCPSCGADVDVIPADGTVINKASNAQDGKETIDEAATKSLMIDNYDEQRPYTSGFIEGAQWQLSRLFTHTQMIEFGEMVLREASERAKLKEIENPTLLCPRYNVDKQSILNIPLTPLLDKVKNGKK